MIEEAEAMENYQKIAAHDLKGPLTTIKAYTQFASEVITRARQDLDKIAYLLEKADSGCDRLTGQIVTQLEDLNLSSELIKKPLVIADLTGEIEKDEVLKDPGL